MDALFQITGLLGIVGAVAFLMWTADHMASSNAASERMWRIVDRLTDELGDSDLAYAEMERRYGKNWSAPATRAKLYS